MHQIYHCAFAFKKQGERLFGSLLSARDKETSFLSFYEQLQKEVDSKTGGTGVIISLSYVGDE